MILIEEIKDCIHPEIKTHFKKRDINNLADARTTADDFALTHKLSAGNTSGPNQFNQYHKGKTNSQKGTKVGNLQSGSSRRVNKDPSRQNQRQGMMVRPQ